MPHSCFLDNSSAYCRVLRSRRHINAHSWRLYGCRNKPVNVPRFAVVVAKRHVRSAVQRNRLRRLLREYFRQELRFCLPAMDYLLMSTKRMALPIDAKQLRAECRAMFGTLLQRQL